MSTWNRPKATHIYTVSLTLCLSFCKSFLTKYSITHATHTNIYIYILECVTGWYEDAAEFICGFTGT